MNAVWNSYGQLCGCPEIFKKSCKFFCRELDIRVAYAVYAYQRIFLHTVNLCVQYIICLMQCFIESLASRIRPVDAMACCIQGNSQIIFYRISIFQIFNSIQNQSTHVIKIICFFIQAS